MFVKVKAFLQRLHALRTRLGESIAEFAQLEAAGGIVLLAATVIALVLANSGGATWWHELWHAELGVYAGSARLAQSALEWVNDALMVVFFFVVGLEIKREVIAGELSSPRKAILPIIAAVGGMLVPALAYMVFNHGTVTANGWAIPMATDIAFALGIIALLGERVPASLKVFVSAFAIADDIGAVLVIALFYTAQVSVPWLAAGAALLLVLMVFNRARVDSALPYLLVGVGVWFCCLQSGVHATVAGVLVAFTIPVRARLEPRAFADWARGAIAEIERMRIPSTYVLEVPELQRYAWKLQKGARFIQAPLQRIEHMLHPISTFVVLPVFALANAGVALGDATSGVLISPVSLGIFCGLVLGKPIGIMLFTWLAIRLHIAELPEGSTWGHVAGAGCLGGVGFTMSLFISGLAFGGGTLEESAKLAILMSSVIAGIIGYCVLRTCSSHAGMCNISAEEDL